MVQIGASEERVLYRSRVVGQQLVVYFALITMYLFYYFSKYTISPATKPIQGEFGFSSTEFGVVFSTFTMVYAARQFVNGFLGDRYGPKNLMLVGAFGATAANILFGISGSLTSFVLAWSLTAIFLSMGWAPGCRILYNWLPEEKWGSYMGGYNAFCYLGGALVLPLAGYCVATWGWRSSFFIPPMFTAVMGIIFWFLVKSSPKDAGYEVEWAPTNKEAKTERAGAKDYFIAFTHPKMLAAYACDICANLVRWGLLNWMVKILNEPRDVGGFGMTVVMAALVGSLMHWGGAAFSIILGWMQDKFFRGQRWQTILIGFAVSAAAIFILAMGPSIMDMSGGVFIVSAAMFIGGGVIQAVQAPLFNIPGDVLGTRLGGTGSGIMNGWGYVGAIFAGVGLGRIIDVSGFMAGIMVLAGICLVGAILSLFLRSINSAQSSGAGISQ